MRLYDIIGDIHGCLSTFKELVNALDYEWKDGIPVHPGGRKLVFVGDITDRGPRSLDMIRLSAALVKQKKGLYVPGNHCNKLFRYLIGRPVQVTHGLETTVAELEALTNREKKKVSHLFTSLYRSAPLYLILDGGKLIVCHAGIREQDIGKTNKRIESFVLYGDTTGRKDEFGRPERRDWARDYQGDAWIVYGHTPVLEPRWMHHTVNIDTGCVFGGALTALRYPEMRSVSVPSPMPFIEEKFRAFAD